MVVLRINCPKCSGPMWEEDLPDSTTKIDLVCLICGTRKFFDKRKYLTKKKEIEERLVKTRSITRRVLRPKNQG